MTRKSLSDVLGTSVQSLHTDVSQGEMVSAHPNKFQKTYLKLKYEEFEDFQALLYNFKDFQGLEVHSLFINLRTFKFLMTPAPFLPQKIYIH